MRSLSRIYTGNQKSKPARNQLGEHEGTPQCDGKPLQKGAGRQAGVTVVRLLQSIEAVIQGRVL